MNFNKFLKSLFGDKSSRDMKLIQPLVEKVKAVSPQIEQLDNDALRQRTKELQKQVQDSAKEQKARIEELKATIENTPIEERADIFDKIDKIEKEVLEIYEKALDEVMPEVFFQYAVLDLKIHAKPPICLLSSQCADLGGAAP
jgi:preprotein translocase subunit SecA